MTDDLTPCDNSLCACHDAAISTVSKHADHDQKDHGNWANGFALDQGRYDKSFYDRVSNGPGQYQINRTWDAGQVVDVDPTATLHTGQPSLRDEIYPGPLPDPAHRDEMPRLVRDGERLVVVDGHHRITRARRVGQTIPVVVQDLVAFAEVSKHGTKGEPGYPHPARSSRSPDAESRLSIPDQHHPLVSGIDPVTWSPTMTRDEAEVWAKDSSIHVPLTFVGKRPSLERIRESGFHDPLSDNRKHSAGSVWGAGIYLGFADVEVEVDDFDSDWLEAHEEWETRYDQAIAAADLAETIRGQELDAQRYPDDDSDPTISFSEYSVGLSQSRAQREADIEQWRAANPEPDPPTTLTNPSIAQYGPMKLEYPTDLDWKKYDEAFDAWSQRKGEALGMGGLNLIPLTAEWNDAARAYAEANPAPTAPGANNFAQAVLVRANLSKVAHINIPPNDGGYSSQTRIRAIPGVNEVAESEFNLGPDNYIYTEVYGKILRRLGYDALLITQYEDKIFVGDDGVPQDRRVLLTDEGQGYDGAVGGPQLIVWDPTKLTVISDQTPRYMDPVYKHGNKGDPDYPHKPRTAAKRTPKKVDPKVAVQQAISSPPPPWTNQTWWNTVEGNFAKAILDNPDDLSPEVLESWSDLAKENASSYKIYTRVTPRVLVNVLQDGRFLSQHESGSSNGMYSPRSRAIAEHLLHGVDVENDDPGTIFGYVDRNGYGFVDAALESSSWTDDDPVSQYGSIAIEFKDDVRSRTTITIGDSLDQSGVFVVGRTLASEIGAVGPRLHEYGWGVPGEKDSVRFSPVPLDNPTYHAWDPEAILGGWSAGDPSDWAEGAEPYVEAQYHGGVSIFDIKQVIVPQDDMTPELLDMLNAYNMTFQVLGFTPDNGVEDVTDQYTGGKPPESVATRIARIKGWSNTHGYAGQTIPVPNTPYVFKVIEKDFDPDAGLKPRKGLGDYGFAGVSTLQVEALHPDDGSQVMTAIVTIDSAATEPEFSHVQFWAGDEDPLDRLRTYLTAVMSGTPLPETEGQDSLFKHGSHDQKTHGRRGSASALRRRGKQGGFTFHPTTVRYPSSGYAVATPGNSKIFTPSSFTDEALVDYIDSHAATLAANPALHLGGWYDRANDEMVLDLVEVFDNQDQAVQAGRNRNEQAIFDLKNLAEISTGGTGGREDLAVVGKSGRGWSALQLAVDVAGGEGGVGEAGPGGDAGLAPSLLKHATHNQKTHGNRNSAPRDWDHLLDRMFPDGALRTSVLPWRRMPPRLIGGDRVYDMETVLDGLNSEVTDVDTNDLHANQGAVTRAGVSHYLDPATRDTIYGSSNKVNKIPTIYRRRDGRNVILSGHHRAAAAWLRGVPLRARVIHERAPLAKHADHDQKTHGNRISTSRVDRAFRNSLSAEAHTWSKLAAFVEETATGSYVSLARDDDGQIVGAAAFYDYQGDTYLNMLFVRDNQQGKGVGSALMRAVAQHVTGKGGTRKRQLLISGALESAQSFYDRFTVDGINTVEGEALERLAKHADHDQESHGNWARSAANATYTTSYRKDPYGEPAEPGIGWAVAKDGDEVIGALQWDADAEPPVVRDLSVDERYRRQGVATKLWEAAKKVQPSLVHSDVLSDEGREFAAVTKHGTKGTPNYPHRSRVTELFGDEQKISIFKPGLFAGPMAEARVWDPEGEEFYDEKYDLDIIREMLPTAPTRMVDPSQLRATQSTLTRVALEHYLSSDEKFSRRSDQSKVTGLNDVPVGWLNSDGTINIVSGHHRAAAAVLKGVPLKMRIIDQTVHKHGTKGSPGYSILHPRTRTGEINPVTITDRARNNAADWMAERDLDQVTLYANTAAILDRADARSLDYGRDWYATAHRVAINVAEAGGIGTDIAAAILAALSPRNKWRYPDDSKYLTHGNVADAFKLVDAINNPILVELDAATARKASKMYKIDIAPGEYWTDQVDARMQAAIDPRVKGMPDNLTKAFRLARGEGSPDAILGGPKVRSFHNNILLVDESASATIDSHQVRAMIGRIDLPDKVYEEIASNPARYEYFADVVRALAADRNLPPHVVQAITWEQWRLEHPEDVRAKENASNIASAKDVTLGSVTYDAPVVAKTPLREGD